MAANNLAHMTDMALLKLFSVNSTHSSSRRAQQIRAELERRGYIFDLERQTFITCEQWNMRHPEAQRGCAEEAQKRGNDERRRGG